MFVLILNLLLVIVKATINPFGPTVVQDFTNCLHGLIKINFDESGVLIFATTNNLSTPVARIRTELLKKIHETVQYSVEISGPEKEVAICVEDNVSICGAVLQTETFEKPLLDAKFVVLIIDNYNDFIYLASKLIKLQSWNPGAKFIVLFFNFSNTNDVNVKYAEKIITTLYKHNVINIVVAVPQSGNIRKILIYGWKPFDPPKFCGYFNETAHNRLILENTCERGVIKQNRALFKNNLPCDMKQCTLYILALERQPFVSNDADDFNLEKILINQMVKHYNFNTNYKLIKTFRGEREENGQWNGALKELTFKKGQILLGGIFPDFDVHEDFDYSSSYLADSYTWVVPRAYVSPPWVALTITFHRFVWYSAIVGFFISVFAWYHIGKLSKDTIYHRSLSHCFINTLICSLGFCTYSRPIKKSLRIFFVFFNLYCIIFITAYQTKLFDVLKNPTYEYQIQTVEELIESGLKFGGTEELHDLFFNSSDPFDYHIGAQWIDVDDTAEALIDVVVHRNFSLICSRLELAHITATMPELSDNFGNFKYYAFESNIFTVPLEMVSLRGFAFMGRFSESLSRFKQLGVNEGVRRDFATFNMRRTAKLMRALESQRSEVNALSIQHLQGGFFALAWGYISGIVVLVVEIIIESSFVKTRLVKFRKPNN